MNINDIIKKRFPNEKTQDLANELGWTYSKLANRAYNLGIKKSEEFKMSDKSGRYNLIEGGKATRFKKGHEPHNKGVPMSSHVYERVKHTMFKKGIKPNNTQPIGTIHWRMDKNGRNYAYIKIKDRDWRLMHRVVWEQHYGPIPPKHVVRFKDGNTMNWDISNLEMISQCGNMECNTIQRFPAELQEVIKLKCKLKRKINGTKQN